jgi:hypothetical protein
MSPYKILLIAFVLYSGSLFSQNKIDFSRPAEASLIEDKITEWIDLLYPETYYFFKKDSSSENYSNWNGLYIGEGIKQCSPGGPDEEIFVNCDTICYFKENDKSYAMMVFRHLENGENTYSDHPWYREQNFVWRQKISFVILKWIDNKWKIEEKIEDNKFLSEYTLLTGITTIYEFTSPKIIIFGRKDILIEVSKKSAFGGYISMAYNAKDSTLLYHLSFTEPILSTNSEEFHFGIPFNEKNDSNKSVYYRIKPNYYFDGENPVISIKLISKLSDSKFLDEYKKDNEITENDIISLSEIEKSIAETEKRKSEIEVKYSLNDLKKAKENQVLYYPKKYDKISEKEAHDLITGKSLSYYYFKDSYFQDYTQIDDYQNYDNHKKIPYVNHIFLENGDYYKIINTLEQDRAIPGYSTYCTSFFPAIVKKGRWIIKDNKIILELEEYNFDKFNRLKEDSLVEHNYENYNTLRFDTKTSKDINNLRTGWPFTNTIDIDKLTKLESLLYEIAETECNYGYRIGNRFNLYNNNNNKVSAFIEITNEPLGNNGISQMLSDIKRLEDSNIQHSATTENKSKTKVKSRKVPKSKKEESPKKEEAPLPEDFYNYDLERVMEIQGDLELLKIRNEKFLKIYSNLKDYKKFKDAEKFEMNDTPNEYRKNEKKEEAPKK